MTSLILIRHGDTKWTAEKRYQGSTDIPLSVHGRTQMRTLAKAFNNLPVDKIYSSQLGRSIESAEIVAKTLKLTPVADVRLNEINFGQWEGKSAQELADTGDKFYQRWANGHWVTAPKGESTARFKKRVELFLKQCLRKNRDENVAIVSHGGTMRMIILIMLKLPLKYLFHFHIDTAAVTVIKDYGTTGQLMSLNTRGEELKWILKK